MDQWIQWAITTIVAILGVLAGRFWEGFDRKLSKDRDLIRKIDNIIPIDSNALLALRENAYANPYKRKELEPLWNLEKLLRQPGCFFLDKRLEKNKSDLMEAITDFHNFITDERFVSQKDPESYFIEFTTTSREKLRLGEQVSEDEFSQIIEEDRKHFFHAQYELVSLSMGVCDRYDTLVINAHKIL